MKKLDLQKTKKELIEALQALRIGSAEKDFFQKRLGDMEKSYHEMQSRFEELSLTHEKECQEKDRTQETLSMAQVIIDNSPAILFDELPVLNPVLFMCPITFAKSVTPPQNF